MRRVIRYAGQAALYALFAATIGVHSTAPPYRLRQPDDAVLKLSVSHAGQLKAECRQRSAEEVQRLPPNMRTAMDCPRERSPLELIIELDGQPLYSALLPPAGLARDGASSVYRRFALPGGRHQLRARLRDHIGNPDFNYVSETEVDLAPGQVLVIDFNARRGGFTFR